MPGKSRKRVRTGHRGTRRAVTADEAAISVRRARKRDWGVIVAITKAVFAPMSIDAHIERLIGRPKGVPWHQVKAQTVREELAMNPAGCFVAEIGGQVVGYVTTAVNALASRGTIANVAVLPDCQGLGIGRRLLETVLEHFRKVGLVHAKIETLECNPVGQHLYPSLGFREVIRQIHYVMPLET